MMYQMEQYIGPLGCLLKKSVSTKHFFNLKIFHFNFTYPDEEMRNRDRKRHIDDPTTVSF